MKRKSKHLTTLIKDELQFELKLSRLQNNEVWNLQHAAKLIKERMDDERITELVDLFRISEKSIYASIGEFYTWYRFNRLDENDSIIYQIFDSASEQLNFPQCDPKHFSGMGNELIGKINVWKGDAGNQLNRVLFDYFFGILPKACKLNKALVTSPKSLLGDYGWSLFEEHLFEVYGGKNLYLTASEEAVKEANKESKILLAIQSIKNKALVAGNITVYDEIGAILSKEPLLQAFEIIKNKNSCIQLSDCIGK